MMIDSKRNELPVRAKGNIFISAHLARGEFDWLVPAR